MSAASPMSGASWWEPDAEGPLTRMHVPNSEARRSPMMSNGLKSISAHVGTRLCMSIEVKQGLILNVKWSVGIKFNMNSL